MEQDFEINLPSVLVLCGVIICYLGTGGRMSIALCVVVIYVVTKRENDKNIKNTDNILNISNLKISESESCCGKKGDKSCCLKSGKISTKKHGCCGGDCSKKSSADKLTAENMSQSIAIDFTQNFKPKKKASVPKLLPKVINKKAEKENFVKNALTISNEKLLSSQIYIFYGSLQGAAERCAKFIFETLTQVESLEKEPILLNLSEIDDLDEYFIDVPCENALYVLVLPSYDTECPIDYFLETLEENFQDFRIDKYPLRKLIGYTVLGLGDLESWPEKFCYQAKSADLLLSKLGGRRIYPLGEVCMKYEGNSKIKEWLDLFIMTLMDNEPILYEYDEFVGDNNFDELADENTSKFVADMEDIVQSYEISSSDIPKKMISKDSPTYKNLSKQGYTIVGSHSGVKICRWTKNDLRGRGSCYKHSLFNIVSSRCMELTPSLACSSKCVFCWRHGTNPVSKSWKWEIDEPEYILENALEGHYAKIKQMRGVPGVIAERFAKAFQVRHCALSLVGEPIMYPYINKFIELLHEKDITSFLVCNAQHPEQLKALNKVTQLYVSIDAPTKQELKKIDRPLHKDFWERMMYCLDIIKTTQSHQRTVFRLTLLKGFNMSDVTDYADLVEKGSPCFIEVKGATFCGSSDGNGNPLTMQNIPFYEECVNFANELTSELKRRGLNYEAAAEHAHSNCILISHTKFKINNKWCTHIDFDRFFQLLRSGEEFTHMDYTSETPEWALFGNGGFAPNNTRFYKKRSKILDTQTSESNTSQVSKEPITTSTKISV